MGANVHRLSEWVVRHRLTVGLVWLAITVAGLLIAPSLSGRLKDNVHLNSSAFTANQQIAQRYGGAASDPGVLVIDLPARSDVHTPAVAAQLRSLDSLLHSAAPGLREISYANTGDTVLIGRGGTSTIVLAYPPSPHVDLATGQLDQLVSVAHRGLPAATVHGTGLGALASGSTSGGHSSVLIELLVGALGALIVLAWVFGSFLALLPLIMALISVLTMQLLIYGLSFLTPSSVPFAPAVQYIVALLGLGLSIDYSLLVVNRWRAERAAGRSNTEAVHEAMRRAGHAVVFSGLTASLGLFALIVVPVSLVQGIAVAGLFVPSTATLVALTLLPLALSTIGPKMDWPRRRPSRNGQVSRFWTKWARLVIRHRVVAAVVGLGILVGLGAVGATINISEPAAAHLATGGAYADGLKALTADGFPSGTLTTVPIYVPHATDATSAVQALERLDSLRGAIQPAGAAWHDHGSTMVFAIPKHEVGTSAGGSSLADIRTALPPGVLAGGDPAQQVDQVHTTYSAFPLMFAVVALVTFLLLARGLRSILLPAKAVLLNALSVAATYGLLVLVFQHGIGTQLLWGVPGTGSISTFVPLMLFGFLFGISMDYEVFILTRVQEGYERTRSTDRGIVEGISHTGRLVTSAALILFLAMVSLASANDVVVRELAAGMAAGVLLDAVVVRMLLLPTLISLFGSANWWLPRWAARIMRLPHITDSHTETAPHPAAIIAEPADIR